MTGSFFGIEMGKRSLQQFQTALEVTGHNISNLKTEGYSRQRVVMRTLTPLHNPSLNRPERAGQIGQGMEITTIERVKDQFIEARMHVESGTTSYWKTRFNYLQEVESLYNEPTSLNLRSDLDEFWNGWQDLANNPSEIASRNVVVERGNRISASLNNMYTQLRGLRDNANNLVESNVKRINELSNMIADLNSKILKVEAMGDNPNDYLDKRDLYIQELSNMADITVKSLDPDETIIYIGSRHLIQGELVSKLELVRNGNNDGYYDVRWAIDGVAAEFKSGEMKGLLEIRDIDLLQAMNDLNTFTVNLVDGINEIHRTGFGLNQETGNDFFKTIPITPSANGDYDLAEDGINDSTLLFKITGVNELNPKDMIGAAGTLTFANVVRGGENITINYNSQMKVEEIMTLINTSEANVSVYLNERSELVFKAKSYDDYLKPNYVISHIEDSGAFLTGIAGVLRASGAEGAYDAANAGSAGMLRGDARYFTVTPQKNAAMWIGVSDTIKRDVSFIAASGGIDTTGGGENTKWNGIGDGSNSLRMANLRFKDITLNGSPTFNDFYTANVMKFASRAETANLELQKQNVTMQYLEKMRQSVSGVNLDEEMAQMVVYQHGYNASARVVSVMDKLLDTVINRMGV